MLFVNGFPFARGGEAAGREGDAVVPAGKRRRTAGSRRFSEPDKAETSDLRAEHPVPARSGKGVPAPERDRDDYCRPERARAPTYLKHTLKIYRETEKHIPRIRESTGSGRLFYGTNPPSGQWTGKWEGKYNRNGNALCCCRINPCRIKR